MPDVLRALAISGSILVAVVILIVVVSFATVRRGEVAMSEDVKKAGQRPAHH